MGGNVIAQNRRRRGRDADATAQHEEVVRKVPKRNACLREARAVFETNVKERFFGGPHFSASGRRS
jgi:hypothetical protein